MKIKCIIIDDEPLAISIIQNYLKDISNLELVGAFNNPINALNTIENNEVDVLFLDINMSQMNGLEFLKTLTVKPLVVITTAYREFAVESFDLDVLDYLVKPIPFDRFVKATNKITNRFNALHNKPTEISLNNEPYIFLKVDKKLMKIMLNNILYIESLKDYIKVITIAGDYLVHKSMTSISNELPGDNFIRIHRSYTIAINKVTSVEGNSVEIGKRRIPIGRNYLQHAKQVILNIDTED